MSVCPSVIMLCGMLKYGTSCYLALGLLCFGCSVQITIFFLINSYKEINQSVDSKQDGKSLCRQTDGRVKQWMFGHNENSHANFKVLWRSITIRYVSHVYLFLLFIFIAFVWLQPGGEECSNDVTRTHCNVVSLLGLYRVECTCRPKVSSTGILTLITW
jgi:hypothetical protein